MSVQNPHLRLFSFFLREHTIYYILFHLISRSIHSPYRHLHTYSPRLPRMKEQPSSTFIASAAKA